MKHDYSELLRTLPYELELYEEDTFVYFLPCSNVNCLKGTLLLEEKEDCVVIWNNEIEDLDYADFYTNLSELICCDLLIVYLDNQDEYDQILSIGGECIEFTEGNYDCEFGFLIIRNN